MNSRAQWTIVVLVAILVIGALAMWWYAANTDGMDGNGTPTNGQNGNGGNGGGNGDGDGSGEGGDRAPLVSSVRLAMLDSAGVSQGPTRGCDKVVMVPWNIVPTTAPLTAAMQALFGLSTTSVAGNYNFIDRTNETLRFERATVVDGTAHIYLAGSLSGLAGVCDDPRAMIQIEETALQFSTVEDVQLYLNGVPTDLVPSQR